MLEKQNPNQLIHSIMNNFFDSLNLVIRPKLLAYLSNVSISYINRCIHIGCGKVISIIARCDLLWKASLCEIHHHGTLFVLLQFEILIMYENKTRAQITCVHSANNMVTQFSWLLKALRRRKTIYTYMVRAKNKQKVGCIFVGN